MNPQDLTATLICCKSHAYKLLSTIRIDDPVVKGHSLKYDGGNARYEALMSGGNGEYKVAIDYINARSNWANWKTSGVMVTRGGTVVLEFKS